MGKAYIPCGMSPDKIRKTVINKMPKQLSNFDEWARRGCVAIPYLVVNKTAHTARCTRCSKSFTFMSGKYEKHLQKITEPKDLCPHCKEPATVLHDWRGRKNKTDWFRTLTFARRGRTVWAALWECEANYESITAFDGAVEIRKILKAVYRFNSDKQEYFKAYYSNFYGNGYKQHKIPKLPFPTNDGWGNTKYWITYARTENIRDIFLKSDAKYLLINNAEHMPPDMLISHLHYGLKYQAYELLSKAGFLELARERLKGAERGSTAACNWRGKSLEKILRLPTRWVKYLREHNPNHKQLEVFQKLSEEERRSCSWKLIEDIASYHRSPEEYKKRIEEWVPFVKWTAYISEQVECSGHSGEFMYYNQDYIDYIETAAKLGMDIRKKKILYPDNLNESHDQVMSQWEVAKDEILDRLIEQNARADSFEGQGFVIVSARSQEDLNKESAKLGHCVKTYGGKIAEGRCLIFFVRRKEDPETPFYTLETSSTGKFVQCRGKNNCSMTEPVKLFTTAFTQKLQKEIKKERKQQPCQTA